MSRGGPEVRARAMKKGTLAAPFARALPTNAYEAFRPMPLKRLLNLASWPPVSTSR